MTTLTRRLLITVTYDEPDELSADDILQLEANLHFVANFAAGNGMLTNDTVATVDTWEYKVERVQA